MAIAAIMLMANSCSSPVAQNQPVVPTENTNPNSFSVTQEPVPSRTPAPVPVNTPTPLPTSTPGNVVTSTSANPPAGSVPPPTPIPSPAVPAAQAQVNVQNFSFNPAVLNIAVGTTVIWTNNDSVPHQIASNSFSSSPLSQGQTFSQKFTAVGSYDYHCAIHPSMTGKIIVK